MTVWNAGMNTRKGMEMYRFTSEKALFAWADMTLQDWIKNNALDYDDFEDMKDDIGDVLSDVTDVGYATTAFDSFMLTARDSAYIKGVFDCATSCRACGYGVTTTTTVNLMYRTVISNCYERNIDKYRLLWEMNRKV